MHFGTTIPNNFGVDDVSDLVDFGVAAEVMGYASVWVSDHLFHAAYVASRLGDRPYHEPMTVLTAIAARTESVNLGTSVLVLPWHHPVRLAKVIASLDNFSNGRFIMGVGVGVTEDEYAALGIPFAQRGRIANEYLAAMQSLWQDDIPSFSGEHLSFDGLRFVPKPKQSPYPPIWVGGNSRAAHRRLARFGDGWHPLGLSPEGLAEARLALDAEMVAADRRGALPVAVRLLLSFADKASKRPVAQQKALKGDPTDMAALVEAYRDAGVTHVILDGASPDLAQARDDLERFQAEVIPKLRSTT